jgi:hypothetical protein
MAPSAVLASALEEDDVEAEVAELVREDAYWH